MNHKQQIHFYAIRLSYQTTLFSSRCYLEVGNGIEYPDIHLKLSTDFENLFPFVYFDLTKQKMDIKDGVTKLAFHYKLATNPDADYNLYALVLREREAEIEQKGGKLLVRAKI